MARVPGPDSFRSQSDQQREDDDVQYFMRCRLLGQRWVKCWTRIPEQPEDGFTVPAKLSEGEVEILCEAYQTMDADGRDLIRATACSAE